MEELIESVCRRKYKERSFNIGVRNRVPEIFVKLEKIVDGKCEYHRSKESKSGKRYAFQRTRLSQEILTLLQFFSKLTENACQCDYCPHYDQVIALLIMRRIGLNTINL